MSLFSRHKLSEYESSDYQQQLNEFKYKITKFEDRLDKLQNDLECKSQGEPLQDVNVINAEEAANRVEKAAQKALPHELREAFDEINSAIENEQQRVRLYQYEFGAYVGANGKPQRKRIYHIDTLSRELKKYGYETKLDSNDSDGPYSFLEVSWKDKNISNASKIDPAKKYVLPLEDTECEITDSVTGKAISHEVAYACPRDNKWKIIYDRKICSDAVIVPGKDIIDVPKWVRAVEPIEIEC